MNSIQICMLAILGVTVLVLLRKWNADFTPLLRLCLALMLSATVIALAAPLVSYLRNLTEIAGVSGYAEPLLKALGIAALTQCCAELCRESGETGAATGVELAGKVEILLLSLPLIGEILDMAKELLSLA